MPSMPRRRSGTRMIEAALILLGYLVFALALYALIAFEQHFVIKLEVLEQRVRILEERVDCE